MSFVRYSKLQETATLKGLRGVRLCDTEGFEFFGGLSFHDTERSEILGGLSYHDTKPHLHYGKFLVRPRTKMVRVPKNGSARVNFVV